MITEEQGKKLISLAKKTISLRLAGKEIQVDPETKKEFQDKKGAFVTLKISGELRGCIGITEPIYPLWQTIVYAAESVS